MDFRKEIFDGLRSKGFDVGPEYVQTLKDGWARHHFVSINGIAMPVEFASYLNRGLVSLKEIAASLES